MSAPRVRFMLGLPTDDVGRHEEFGTVAAVAEMARTAEAAGYHGVFVTDHPIPPDRFLRSGGHHALEPTVVLAAAATATTRLRLMTNLLVVAYRHPFIAAKAIASLDWLSGGRVIMGTGAGYLREEFAALGVDFERRGEILDEALGTMKAVWSGASVSLRGDGWVADGHTALPAPVQWPHPPIWIGGNSRQALRRVVAHGDGWIPLHAPARFARFVRSAPLETVADLAARLDWVRRLAAEEGGRPPADVMIGPLGYPRYGTPAFDAAAYLDAVHELAALGVTHVPVSFAMPGSGELPSRARYVALAEAFARDVVARVG
jgi:probable F420-dependent oxidoreductase